MNVGTLDDPHANPENQPNIGMNTTTETNRPNKMNVGTYLTLLLGVIGNLLIIVSITGYRCMKSPTNIFLASLAFADLILCVVCLPIKLAELFSFTWTFGLFLCKFVNYMQYISAVASVLNLTVMSLERCYAIVYPLKAKSICTVSKAQRVVFWSVGICLFPRYLPFCLFRHKEVGLVQKVFWCVRDDESPLFWQIHEIYSLLVLLVLPGTFMVIAYSIIARKVCHCMKEERTFLMNSSYEYGNTQTSPTHRRVIRMLAAIVVVFVLCWSPFLVMNIFRSFGVVNISLHGFVKYDNTTFTLMAYLNSALNPIIYGFMSQNFRDNFRRTVGCLKSRDEIEANQMNSLNLGKFKKPS
ncbi:unnamed protein product [Lepeophtheirus salmonis]|uniref:(salmon louse) hypothetical protein n=1 Tax=Lepeophtheirus salmonis TaxID=72036 RepID=A0A7R8CZE2_LEPSM|nr:unnamed protein product [Lepeophtheirus salmonis]CAF2949305.1 unnamed protein product [Lepeophtheirus salmonis]